MILLHYYYVKLVDFRPHSLKLFHAHLCVRPEACGQGGLQLAWLQVRRSLKRRCYGIEFMVVIFGF